MKNLNSKLFNTEVDNLEDKMVVTDAQDNKIFLEWNNINYTIKLTKSNNNHKKINDNKENLLPENENNDPEVKKILQNNNGFALPNQVLAILGPSGCGKTSLLNIIAKRQLPIGKEHIITSEVKCNNILMNSENFGKICAYIMQDDILFESLTPQECLYYGAKLKLNETNDRINARVITLIKQVKFFF